MTKTLIRIAGGFFAVHLVFLFVLQRWFDGAELTEDVGIALLPMATRPLEHFLGATGLRQYPPLQGFLLSPASAGSELTGVSLGTSLRVYLALINSCCFAFVLGAASKAMGEATRLERTSFWTLLIPVMVFPAVVIPQDEVLGTALLLALIAVPAGTARRIVGGLSLAGGKIFFALWMVMDIAAAAALRRVAARAVTYAAIVIPAYWFHLHGELRPFVPPNYFGISLWSLAPARVTLEPALMYPLSLGVFGAFAAILLCWRWRGTFARPWRSALHRIQSDVDAGIPGLFLAVLWLFLICFYQVNPEYYHLTLVPVIFCLLSRPAAKLGQVLPLLLLLDLAWFVNLVQGAPRLMPFLELNPVTADLLLQAGSWLIEGLIIILNVFSIIQFVRIAPALTHRSQNA